MGWRFDAPPKDRWIVALEWISNIDKYGDLPPITVKWDGDYFADREGATYNIRAWAECPQPVLGEIHRIRQSMPSLTRDIIIEEYEGVFVARDDYYPGGTKARIFSLFYDQYDEVVYACSALSWSQLSLALTAKTLGKRATIFCAARASRTLQTSEAAALGAGIHEIKPGYLSVVRARAESYVRWSDRYLAPLGFDTPEVIEALSKIAVTIPLSPDEVWCASGSGVLTRSLQKAWPQAKHHAVQVGKVSDTGKANVHVYDKPFEYECKFSPPFPCEKNYDRKAWELCSKTKGGGKVLFWNVVGDHSCFTLP